MRFNAETDEQRARRLGIEQRLHPWANKRYEKMVVDLDLLVGILDDSEEALAKTARDSLNRLVTAAIDPEDWEQWLKENRASLKWNVDRHCYQ